MNIFELYLDKIKSTIVDLNKHGELIIPETFSGINAEIPPANLIVIFQPMLQWYFQK
tara:strand:- start:801 stop:971 length:171 start_codon:yes stop_codon:yes gene_type:complete